MEQAYELNYIELFNVQKCIISNKDLQSSFF